MNKVIFVSKDGKKRKLRAGIAKVLSKAGKGYALGADGYVAEPRRKDAETTKSDLFSRTSDGSMAVSQVRPSVAADDDDDEPLVSEAVKQFAADQGVDLEKVQGTGKNGRVKRADVQAYKTRMLSADSGVQSYKTTELSAE